MKPLVSFFIKNKIVLYKKIRGGFMNKRYNELDSLRGLAASTVLLSHLFLILPGIYLIAKFKNTPLHIFWAGHEAVILFFILSGFVLSLPYFNKKEPSYKNYLIKRISRIYIPYIVSVLIAVIFMSIFSGMGIPALGNWFNSQWTTPVSSKLIIMHIIFLGEFKTEAFNGVIWSLIHEMRVSIIFPVLVYLVKKYDSKRSIIIAMSCSFIYFLLYYFFLKVFKYDVTMNLGSYFATLHYTAFFILGSVLAKQIRFFNERYIKLTSRWKISSMVVAVLLYTYTWWFPKNISILHQLVIEDWSIAVGSMIFIIFCVNSKTIKKALLIKPVHFVGLTSYSLYLFHMPVLLTLINIYYGKMPLWLILIMAFVSSYIFAGVTYYIIEKPSIKLGKILTNRKPNIKPLSHVKEIENTTIKMKV
jgi:peptidoglycan/LPS O-acetylase OafA/YrhL